MPGRDSANDRAIARPVADLRERIGVGRRGDGGSENHGANPGQTTGQVQLGQHPIDTVERFVDVLEEEQGIAEWRVADIKDVEQVTVAAVSRLFEETRLTHIPVMETGEDGGQRLRGLLSGAKVRRLLRIEGAKRRSAP